MKRIKYVTPEIEIIYCKDLCETLPVYFSDEGPGDPGGKDYDFENEDEERTNVDQLSVNNHWFDDYNDGNWKVL